MVSQIYTTVLYRRNVQNTLYFLAGGVTSHKQYYYIVNTTYAPHLIIVVKTLYNKHGFFSIPLSKFQDSTSNLAMNISFHILSNLLFINNHMI
jgi:hypothetical protein